MAMPHEVQKRKIIERLKEKQGREKINEIKKIQESLPGYNTGPYGELKKWLKGELDKARTTSEQKHVDWLGVERQGERQFVLVGAPSSGKSSLLSKLSGMDIKIARYQFTTLKPIPAIVKINGAQIQIVDLPGLIKGATEDKGGGRRLIGIVKNTDGIIIMVDLTRPFSELDKILKELEKADIEKDRIILGNKLDIEGTEKKLEELENKFPNDKIIGISSQNGKNFDKLKDAIWKSTKLIRVFPKDSKDPIILEEGSKVEDFTRKVHKKLLKSFEKAIINGPSAKFSDQRVGLEHELKDNDMVKVVA